MSGFRKLDDHWLQHLALSGIDEDEAARQHLATDRHDNLLFPIHDLDGRPNLNLLGQPDDYVTTRLKYPKGSMKYRSPDGREVEPYLPVLKDGSWHSCRNADVELFATEGAKKAIAGVKFDLLTFALPGIYSFLTKPDTDESVMIAALRYLPIVKNQRVGIVFDQETDPDKAKKIWAAAVRLAKLLRTFFGAKPFIVKLRCACRCKGLDDYLVKHKRAAFDKLDRVATFDDAIEWGRPASKVEKRRIEWRWEGRLARGLVHAFYGFEGVGKSYVWIAVAAAITRGEALPFDARPGVKYSPENVVIFAGEDPAEVVRERLEAHGADLDRVRIIEPSDAWVAGSDEPREVTLPDDLSNPTLRPLIEHAALVIVDVFNSFAPERARTTDSIGIRRQMTRYGRVARETGAAVVIISHLSRAKDQKTADGRVGGSLAIAQYSRVRGVFGHLPADAKIAEPERRCALVIKKNSYAELPEAIVYERASTKRPTVEFLEARKDVFADDMIRVADEPVTTAVTAIEHAKQTIVQLLANGSIETEKLERSVVDLIKTSARTYKRARQDLARSRVIVLARHSGPNQPSRWRLAQTPGQAAP